MKRVAYLAWGVLALLLVYVTLGVVAPRIQSDVDGRTEAAVAATAPRHPVAVDTDGRDVRLSGLVDSAEERDRLAAAARETWGARGPAVDLEVLPQRTPYDFTISRDADGVVIAGAAPSAGAAEAIRATLAETLGPETAAGAEIFLAAGAPGGDATPWGDQIAAGADALSRLESGRLSLEDDRVALSGASPSEETLNTVRALASGAPGAPWDLDLTLIKPTLSPFTLTAAKAPTGTVSLTGYAPAPEQRAAIADAAAGLAGGAGAETDLRLADGAPAGDWTGDVIRMMAALGPLSEGVLAVTDDRGVVTGRAASAADALAAADALRAAGGDPAQDLALDLDRAGISAEKAVGGGVSLRGAAPEADIAALRQVVDQAFPAGAMVDLLSTAGPTWAERSAAEEALGALAALDSGRLEVEGAQVTLAGASQSEAVLADIETRAAAADTPWTLDLRYERPTLAPFPLTLSKTASGEVRLSGGAPDAAARERLLGAAAARVPADGPAFTTAPGDVALADGAPAGWTERALSLAPLLDALGEGALEIQGDTVRLSGTVATPEAADALTEDLAALAGPDATAALTPLDPRRAASARIGVDGAAVALDGRLPEGLDPAEARTLLGLTAAATATGDFDASGRGDVETWRRGLGSLGEFLPEFDRVEVAIDEAGVRVDGSVLPGSDVRQVDRFLSEDLEAAFGGPVALSVGATTAAYAEGDSRANPFTGRPEQFRNGFWLPQVDIAGPDDCARASDIVLLDNRIRFLVDSTELDVRARRVVNELSAIAETCVRPDSVLVLEIGGHTDATGDDGYNLGLSERRAEAVRAALEARGIDTSTVQTVGYGETQPIADNETDEGRAANRRISFLWLPAPTPEERTPENGAAADATLGDPAPGDGDAPAAEERPLQDILNGPAATPVAPSTDP